MNILVTGGGGFVGSHVGETYARQGHRVAVLDNLSRARLLGKSERNTRLVWDSLKRVANLTAAEANVLDRALLEKCCSIGSLSSR